jgi:hypothetical protein
VARLHDRGSGGDVYPDNMAHDSSEGQASGVDDRSDDGRRDYSHLYLRHPWFMGERQHRDSIPSGMEHIASQDV